MRKLIVIAVAAAALSAVGCVKKSTYQALQKEHQDTQATLADRESKIKTLEDDIANKETRIQELDQQIAAKKIELEQLQNQIEEKDAEIAQLTDRRDQLEGDLAAVLKDRARLRATEQEMKQALADLSKRKAEAERRVSQYRGLLTKFKSLIDAGKLTVQIIDGRMVLVLPTDVLFDSGSAKLSTDGQSAIAEVAGVLATLNREFQVEGHTDNVPIKTSRFPSNWELSTARAVVVVKTMVDAGMPGASLSAAGFGEFRPAATNDTTEGKAANRRIEIVLIPDLSTLPGFDELQKAVSS
jgi:chemotaxis protein MotB